MTALYLYGSGYFDGFCRIMKREISFHGHFIYSVFGWLNVAGIGARKGGLRVFIAFHIVFIKMLLHELFGKSESFQQKLKGDVLFAGVNDRIYLIILCLDIFQGRFGIKADKTSAGRIELAKGR